MKQKIVLLSFQAQNNNKKCFADNNRTPLCIRPFQPKSDPTVRTHCKSLLEAVVEFS